MKKAFLILILTTTCGFAQNAQTKEQETSNAEKFSKKVGSLMQRVYFEIGTVKGAKLTVVHYTDLMTQVKQSALRFEYESADKYSTDTKKAVLDADEIDGLIKSINIIMHNVLSVNPTEYTEVDFRTRGGFEAGCFWSKLKWSTYLKLEKYDGKSYVWLEPEDFSVLLKLLEQAKVKL